MITVPKKPLFLVLPYLGSLSLQTRTKLRTFLKGILNCCKLQIVFKSQKKLANAFKDRILEELTSGVVYKVHCRLCNESYYGECVRHLNVKTGEHKESDHWLRRRLSIRVGLLAIICYFSTIHDLLKILVC